MPSSLKHLKKKPSWMHESNWDGPGYYYYRGNSEWTRWSRRRDLKRGSKITVGKGKWKHTTDKKK